MSIRTVCTAAAAAVVLLLAALALAASLPAGGARAAGRAVQCVGPTFKLFDNWNVGGVANGGTPPRFSTGGRAYCLVAVTTYHWNSATGEAPGSIGLGVVQGVGGAGNLLGPWPAAGSPGSFGVPNAGWTATVPAAQQVVLQGDYTCRDSDPATWSQNGQSGGRGFCAVYVRNTPGGPVGALCTPTPPSTYLIYPNHVPAGGVTSFLLWCGTPYSHGFRGAFAPLRVRLYDYRSFTNLRFVGRHYVPISPSFPVRPPLVPAFRVVGPNRIDVTVPPSAARGVYVPLVDYAGGEVPSMNLLNVP